jgi:hypothetical protein
MSIKNTLKKKYPSELSSKSWKRLSKLLPKPKKKKGEVGRLGCSWEVIKRSDKIKGFIIIPKRWIVERTFAWLSFNRRLSKDYEKHTQNSESMIYIAMISLTLKSLEIILKRLRYLLFILFPLMGFSQGEKNIYFQ